METDVSLSYCASWRMWTLHKNYHLNQHRLAKRKESRISEQWLCNQAHMKISSHVVILQRLNESLSDPFSHRKGTPENTKTSISQESFSNSTKVINLCHPNAVIIPKHQCHRRTQREKIVTPFIIKPNVPLSLNGLCKINSGCVFASTAQCGSEESHKRPNKHPGNQITQQQQHTPCTVKAWG